LLKNASKAGYYNHPAGCTICPLGFTHQQTDQPKLSSPKKHILSI